jgi:hypothetical protein
MSKGFSPFSMIGWNGTMISGTVACSSSGDDLGLVMSAMTNRKAGEQSFCLREVLRLGFVEVEDDGDIASLMQLFAQSL